MINDKKIKTGIVVVIAVLIIFLFVGGKDLIMNMFNSETVNQDNQMQSKVQIKEITEGTGEVATVGKELTVNYIGVFADGTKFDSSYDRSQPFKFTLGGWDQGLEGMKVGGKRILVIPPELGYGAEDHGPIPGNSTLIFQIELISVK